MKKKFLLGLVAMALPLASWADGLTVTITNANQSVEYNGANTKSALQIEVKNADGQTLTKDTDYQLLNTSEDKVGSGYTVKAIGISGYLGQDGSATYSVTPKVVTSLTIKDNQITKVYGTADEDIDLADFVSTTQLVDESDTEMEDFLNCLKMSRDEKYQNLEDVGSTILVTFVGDDKATSNYKYDPNSVTLNVPLIITAKELTVTQVKTREYYKGKQFDVSNANAKTFFELAGVLDADKTSVSIKALALVEEGITIEDAGDYPLTVTLDGDKAGNYTVKTLEDNENAHVNLTIDKATLTMDDAEEQDLSKTYGEEDPESLYDQFTFTPSHGTYTAYTLTEEELRTIVTITREQGDNVKYDEENTTNVVGYDITIALTEAGAKNFTLEGYDEKAKPQFVINPKAIGDEYGNAFEGFALVVIEDSIVYRAVPYEGYHETEGDPIKDFVTVTYTGSEETEGELLTEGEDYFIYISATKEGESTDAGSVLTLGVFGRGNYTGSIFKQNLTIDKAELEITPKEGAVFSKVYNGKDSGNLNDRFEFKGLLETDEEGNENPDAVLKMRYSGTVVGSGTVEIYKAAGGRVPNSEYKSTDTDKGLQNYVVTYDKVRYEILSADFTLNGDPDYAKAEDETPVVTNTAKINQYAGLTTDVTIENLTSLNNAGYQADRWYTLVLPFDVTVREISAQFGYAIVNVPQKANDDDETMVFRLTMGTIPAHTPMAFKVDATNTDDEDEVENRQNPTLSFEKKEIVAIPEDWFTDEQGNKAIGTYEPKYINGEKEFFLIPGGTASGNFRRGSVTPMTITPLNVYFDFNKTPGNNARLILEEADGSTTAINTVTGETIHNAAEGWYTIGGVKLNAQPTEKGVYINNGMKVVIK